MNGNGQSKEPSKGKDNESPSNLTPVGQPKLAQVVGSQVDGRAAVEMQTANDRIDQMNAQITTMQNIGGERSGPLQAAGFISRRSKVPGAVAEEVQINMLEPRGSEKGGQETSDRLLLGTSLLISSRDQVAGEYLPEGASMKVARVLDSPLDQRVIEENDEES